MLFWLISPRTINLKSLPGNLLRPGFRKMQARQKIQGPHAVSPAPIISSQPRTAAQQLKAPSLKNLCLKKSLSGGILF